MDKDDYIKLMKKMEDVYDDLFNREAMHGENMLREYFDEEKYSLFENVPEDSRKIFMSYVDKYNEEHNVMLSVFSTYDMMVGELESVDFNYARDGVISTLLHTVIKNSKVDDVFALESIENVINELFEDEVIEDIDDCSSNAVYEEINRISEKFEIEKIKNTLQNTFILENFL